MLAGILVLLAIMLLPTMRAYLAQQSEYRSLQERVADQERDVAELQSEAARWHDPGYVEQQARERLKFVRPGDKAYQVVGLGDVLAADLQGRSTVVNPGQDDDRLTWYGRVWTSVVLTDALPTDSTNAPLSPVGPRPSEAGPANAPPR